MFNLNEALINSIKKYLTGFKSPVFATGQLDCSVSNCNGGCTGGCYGCSGTCEGCCQKSVG